MSIKFKKYVVCGVALFAALACVAAGQSQATNAVKTLKANEYSVAKLGGTFYSDYATHEECVEAGEKLNEEMAGEGMVLLKNEGTLPFTDVHNISIFGKNSVDPAYDGGGSGGPKGSRHKVDLYEAFENAGYTCNSALKEFYEREDRSGISRQSLQDIFAGPIDIGETAVNLYEPSLKSTFNAYNDAAVIVITRTGSEGSDNGTSLVKDHDGDATEVAVKSNHYNKLSKNEKDMIAMVKSYNFKNIIVVLNTPSAMEIKELKDDPAIGGMIWAGQPGYNGFNALGKILNGEVNPSGHLADTFMADMTKDPTFANEADGSQNSSDGATAMNALLDKNGTPITQFDNRTSADQGGDAGGDSNSVSIKDISSRKNAAATSGTATDAYTMVMYEEGIYVGYRYYETKYATEVEANGQEKGDEWYENAVTYPFGYGLSYTSFNTTVLSSNAGTLDAKGNVEIKVEVENTGSVAGKHVVQLYYEAPYIEGGIEKSAKVLGTFAKTKLLKPGEKQVITLTMKAQQMASYDDTDANKDGHKGYEMDKGTYNIYISKNAHELADGVTAALAYELAETTDFDNDGYTENHVENRFTGEYATLPAEDSGVVFTPMTRAKDAATGERLITPKAPTDDERKDLTGDIQAQLDKIFYLYELEDENSTDVRKRTEADVKAKFGDNYTQATDTTGRKMSKQLKDMAGVEKDDPLWNTVMNEFTWTELIDFVLDGSNGSGKCADFGKSGTSDSDGPIGISQVNYQDAPLTAATFNLELAYKQGNLIGDEALWANINGWHGAGLNIHRSPFNGRNFEYYSEDGILAGLINAQVTIAADKKGFVTFNKHLGLNEQETGRSGLITYASEQTIREIYLKPFQLSAEVGHTNAFMTSMGRFGLVEAYSNYQFNVEIVRNEWGFDGVLITDALNGGSPTSAKSNMQSFSVSGQDIQMANAPSSYDYWGVWDAEKNAPVYTDANGKSTTLWSAYYWTRVGAQNMLYTYANSNLIKNAYDLSGFAAKEFQCSVGYSMNENLGAGLSELGTTNVSYSVTGGELPNGLSLSADGMLSGQVQSAGTYSFTVEVAVDGWVTTSAEFTIDVSSPIEYTGDNMADATVGKAFNGKFTTPLTAEEDHFDHFEVDEDSELPAGLTLADDGTLSGTLTAEGTYTFTINAVCVTEETNSCGSSTVNTPYPVTYTMVVSAGEDNAAAEAKAAADAAQKSADAAQTAADAAQKTADEAKTAAEAAAANKGCGGSVIAAASTIIALGFVAAALAAKKHEEEK